VFLAESMPPALGHPASARFLAILCLISLGSIGATDVFGQALHGAALHLDNDIFDFRLPAGERSDEEYTQGIRARVELSGAPAWIARAVGSESFGDAARSGGDGIRTTLEFGQEIYNSAVDAPRTLPGQRPYAGWLYVDAGVRTMNESHLRAISAGVGITGPPSFAEAVQTRFHRRFGFREPLGWADQLATEPGVQIRYDRARLWTGHLGSRPVVQLMPHGTVLLGNVRTGADVGLSARVGYDIPHAWGAVVSHSPYALYLTGAARGSGVLRNLFLDGNTFRSGPRVEKRRWVGEADGGFGIRVGQFLAEFSLVRRSVEYRTQPTGHTRGSFRFGYEPRSSERRR
jgi:lipid A 3-O-deacylase